MLPEILIVEDERAIADTIVYALKTEGFAPHWCGTGESGLKILRERMFSLVVMDIGLPDGNGFDFCRKIRTTSSVPVLFLSARSGEIDRVVGLEIGGDDYLVKPFSPRELTARVRAILRRTDRPAAESLSIPNPREAIALGKSIPTIEIDLERFCIRFHGTMLDLTRYEFRLLRTLAARPGRVFSREQLLQEGWEEPGSSTDRTIDAHVKTLRAKLRDVRPTDDPIQTHRGLGYSWRET